jgi:hypothetical protein
MLFLTSKFCSNSPHATTKKRGGSPTVKAQHARPLTLFAGKRAQVVQVYRGPPKSLNAGGTPPLPPGEVLCTDCGTAPSAVKEPSVGSGLIPTQPRRTPFFRERSDCAGLLAETKTRTSEKGQTEQEKKERGRIHLQGGTLRHPAVRRPDLSRLSQPV